MGRVAVSAEDEEAAGLRAAAEYLLCRRDRARLFRHLPIKRSDGQIVQLDALKPSQKKLLRLIQWLRANNQPVRIIILKARKTGISTVVEADMFAEVIEKQIDGMVIAHDVLTARKLFDMTQLFYERYDLMDRPRQKKMNARELRFFDHQGRIDVETANNKFAGTGTTPQYLHSSEEPKWETGAQTAISLQQSVSNVPGTTIIREGTANGYDDLFYPAWKAASENCRVTFDAEFNVTVEVTNYAEWNYYYPLFISVYDDPDCTRAFTSEEDKTRFLGTLQPDEARLMAEGSTAEYLNYRRFTLRNQCQNDLDIYHQEHCIAAGVRVGTDEGILRIEEVSGGQECSSGKVIAAGPVGVQPVIRLETALGYSVRSTVDHRIATDDGGWVEVGDLEVGNALIKLRAPKFSDREYMQSWSDFPAIRTSIRIDEVWGRFLGYFMGDGCYSKDTLHFACDAKDVDVVDDIASLILKLFGRKASVRTVRGCTNVVLTCTSLKHVLDKMGLLRRSGKMSRGGIIGNVSVPECIWRSPKNVVREFLRGLFEADGFNGYGYPRIVLFSKHKEFLRDVQLLILGFDITCQLSSKVRHKKPKDGKPGYSYVANELLFRTEESIAFNREIGFLSLRKRSRVDSYLTGKPRQSRLALGMSDTVTSVEPDGEAEVFDLSVSPVPSFDAGGVLVHNCETDRHAFLSSGRPRFSRSLISLWPIENGRVGRLEDRVHGWKRSIAFVPDAQDFLTIYRDPIPTHRYVTSVDTSEGKIPDGCRKPDATAAHVCDIDHGNEIVAVLSGQISEENAVPYLDLMGRYYNMAFIIPETNSTGKVVAINLPNPPYNYPRDRFYHKDDWNPEKSRHVREIGWRTHETNRHHLISVIANAINDGGVIVHDRRIQEECMNFVWKDAGRAEAQRGFHDDHVVALGLALMGAKCYPSHLKDGAEAVPAFLAARVRNETMDSVTGY